MILTFLGFPQNRAEEKQLRRIIKKMKKSGYNYYTLANGRVNVEFASVAYTMYRAISPLQQFFNSYQKTASFSNEVIKCGMTAEQQQLLSLFDPDQIKLAVEEQDFSSVMKETRAQFVQFQNGFTKERVLEINEINNGFETLRSFCSFDFYFMLKQFAPALREGNFIDRVRFNGVHEELVGDKIIDLCSNLKQLALIADWKPVFSFIEKLPGHPELNRQNLTELMALVKQLAESGVPDDLARLIEHDSKFLLKPQLQTQEIVKPYLEQIYTDMKAAFESIFREKKEKYVAQLVGKLFPQGIEESLKYYTAAESKKYEDCGAGGFVWCDAVIYLRAFIDKYVIGEMHEFIEILSVRGSSSSSNYLTHLSELYHDILNKQTGIKGIDLKLDKKFPQGFTIKNYYDHLNTSEDALERLTAEINCINLEAGKLLHSAMTEIYELEKELCNLRTDRQLEIPELIVNWSDIEHYLSMPAKLFFDKCIPETDLFNKLMKEFGL